MVSKVKENKNCIHLKPTIIPDRSYGGKPNGPEDIKTYQCELHSMSFNCQDCQDFEPLSKNLKSWKDLNILVNDYQLALEEQNNNFSKKILAFLNTSP